MLGSKDDSAVRVADDVDERTPRVMDGLDGNYGPEPLKKQIVHDLKLSRHRNV
jgi:hypothetical protein